MHHIQIDMFRTIGENPAYSAYRDIRFCTCQAQINMEDKVNTFPMLCQTLRSCVPGSVPQDRHAITWCSLRAPIKRQIYITHRASRSISDQVAAHTVAAPSAKPRSWVARVRSSGPVRDGETKILNAPTRKGNHMIMRVRFVVSTKSKASRNCVR